MAKSEKPLEGTMTPVAKRGRQVLREAGPWTTTVQRLLAHLRAEGLEWVPEPQGWTTDGREALSYLKGTVPTYPLPEWVYSDAVLKQGAQWLRRLHDATEGYEDPEATWRTPPHKPAEVICHNDFAPYNMVFKDEELVGVIDWDFAAPGPRLWDVAYFAYRTVPLMRSTNPDAPTTSIDLSARVNLVLTAYGSEATVPDLLKVMVQRLDEMASFTASHARQRKSEKLRADAENYARDADFLRTLVG